MNKILITIGFFAMLLAQWFVPGSMIYQQEAVLKDGTSYKFRTQPIDPNDPFRGKYIFLNYEMDRVHKSDSTIKRGDLMYVYIEKDSLGFAQATHASKKQLDIKQDYVKVEAYSTYYDSLRFTLPFNVYYMDEDKAYDAEVAVRIATRDSLANNCYGLVYIKGERAVLADVFVDDVPIKDFVEKD